MAIEDTEATQTCCRSTRHLGVIDVKNARYMGFSAKARGEPGSAAEAMLFDCYNPWAALIQLNSTHPLTGKRILRLGEIAKAKGQSFGSYDVEAAAARVHLSRGGLRGQFLAETPAASPRRSFSARGGDPAPGSSRRRRSPSACC